MYMDYKNKYLKYKSKYLNLKGGGLLEDILKKHGITDLNTEIPGDLVNELNQFFKLTTWKNLLNTQDSSNMNNIIDTYFEKSKIPHVIIPTLPEVIIPTVILPNLEDPLSDIRNIYITGQLTERKYKINMTHILFQHNNLSNDKYNVYGLYYHDATIPDLIQFNMIKDILIEKVRTSMEEDKTKELSKKEIEINKKKYEKLLNDVNSTEFVKTSRYFRVGDLILYKFNNRKNFMYISHFNTWNLESGTGLKMLCTSLLFFYNKFPELEIHLTSGSVDVSEKFYKKIGFETSEDVSDYFLKNILQLIHNKCKYCSDDVKLILQNNDEFLFSSEEMIELII